MKLSDRIMQIKPSPTLAVTALANSLKAQGKDVVGFGSGEPDFDTPESIKNAAKKAIDEGKTKYTPADGLPLLKETVAHKFQRDNNLAYTAKEISINCGGKHSFYNLMQVILNPGDEVIIPAPYWVSYPSMVLLASGNPVIIHATEESNFKITPEQLSAAVTGKTRAVVINSPSNPTGVAYSSHELKDLVSVIADKDILLITDDIYESIVYDGFRFSNVANISDEIKKKTLVLNGVSKTYSMTGWRIGYMAGEESIIKKVGTLQSQSTSNPCSIAQWAAIEAISGDQGVVSTMLEAFTRRRELIINGLNEIDGVSCKKPDGAFYVFPTISDVYALPGFAKVKEQFGDDNNSSNFSSYLLESCQVAVVPGIAFGSDNQIRMSFATSDDNINKGLERIKDAVNKLK